MRFSIITPSFRNSQWLRLCINSVADQQGVEVEHIVQDSCSDDGTGDWLPKETRVKAFIEKDAGMYDAVNRGFARASGELLAYLNCDEQYLPGALKAVSDWFTAHPDADVVLSDALITDSAGDYLCNRYSILPGKYRIWVRFPALTCALFLRRRVIDELGIRFDTQWRDLGDVIWVIEMMKRGVRMSVLPHITSVFTDTGANMNLKPNAIRERKLTEKMAPPWINAMRLPFILDYRVRVMLRGGGFQKTFGYPVYTLAEPDRRTLKTVTKPTSFWPKRSSA